MCRRSAGLITENAGQMALARKATINGNFCNRCVRAQELLRTTYSLPGNPRVGWVTTHETEHPMKVKLGHVSQQRKVIKMNGRGEIGFDIILHSAQYMRRETPEEACLATWKHPDQIRQCAFRVKDVVRHCGAGEFGKRLRDVWLVDEVGLGEIELAGVAVMGF